MLVLPQRRNFKFGHLVFLDMKQLSFLPYCRCCCACLCVYRLQLINNVASSPTPSQNTSPMLLAAGRIWANVRFTGTMLVSSRSQKYRLQVGYSNSPIRFREV
jgi:hypothetical protein